MPPRRILAAALACALAAPAAARDRPPVRGAPEEVTGLVAVRVGGAIPVGNARARVPMEDLVAAAVPVGVELAARGGATTLGLLVEYGHAFVPECPHGRVCSASVIRAGIEVLYRLSPGEKGSGWVGAGLGGERTSVSIAGRSTRYTSFELLNLQAGHDVPLGPIVVGPFVGVALAQGMEQDGQDIKEKSPHAWLQVGIRAEVWR